MSSLCSDTLRENLFLFICNKKKKQKAFTILRYNSLFLVLSYTSFFLDFVKRNKKVFIKFMARAVSLV